MNQQLLDTPSLEKDRADLRNFNSNYGTLITLSDNLTKFEEDNK